MIAGRSLDIPQKIVHASIPRMTDKRSVSRCLPRPFKSAYLYILYMKFLNLFGSMNEVIYTAKILENSSIAGDGSMIYKSCHRAKISLSSRSRNGVQIDRKGHYKDSVYTYEYKGKLIEV